MKVNSNSRALAGGDSTSALGGGGGKQSFEARFTFHGPHEFPFGASLQLRSELRNNPITKKTYPSSSASSSSGGARTGPRSTPCLWLIQFALMPTLVSLTEES